MAWWTAGRTGIAKSASAPNAIHFSSPPAFGGVDGRWSPQDLLLGALAGCYTTTLRTLAESSNFSYTDLQVEVECTIRKTASGSRFGQLWIRPQLTLALEQERQQTFALNLLHQAEAMCLISHALSIERQFEPQVQLDAAAPTVVDHPLPVSEPEFEG
jgi:organic hydroperoxide reductase OsmC/OhrA